MTEERVYEVSMHNKSGGIIKFFTINPDVSFNYAVGNEKIIRFKTIDGAIITLPADIGIEQRERIYENQSRY